MNYVKVTKFGFFDLGDKISYIQMPAGMHGCLHYTDKSTCLYFSEMKNRYRNRSANDRRKWEKYCRKAGIPFEQFQWLDNSTMAVWKFEKCSGYMKKLHEIIEVNLG